MMEQDIGFIAIIQARWLYSIVRFMERKLYCKVTES